MGWSGIMVLFRFSADLGIAVLTCAAVFANRLSLFERVAGEGARFRCRYPARLIFGQDRLLPRPQAITKLFCIKTDSPGLGEDPVRASFFLVNVMLYLLRQYFDLWCRRIRHLVRWRGARL